jgi:hypothetical protein
MGVGDQGRSYGGLVGSVRKGEVEYSWAFVAVHTTSGRLPYLVLRQWRYFHSQNRNKAKLGLLIDAYRSSHVSLTTG